MDWRIARARHLRHPRDGSEKSAIIQQASFAADRETRPTMRFISAAGKQSRKKLETMRSKWSRGGVHWRMSEQTKSIEWSRPARERAWSNMRGLASRQVMRAVGCLCE